MQYLEAIRKKTGLSQEDLAELVGVTQGAVSQWEGGKAIPKISILIKLASIFKCTVDELINN